MTLPQDHRAVPTSGRGVNHAPDRGSVTVFVAIAAVGLLVVAGLVVDGSAKVRAAQRADRVAAQAARAGGQAIHVTDVLAGDRVRVDRRAALAAVDAYLRAAGVEGSASLVGGGSGLAVSTTISAPTVFLGLIGVSSFTVQGSAEAVLVPSSRGALP